ncbi:ribosome maturation factor RimM [Actinobaculum sp. 313]|uniref:ribosome maturation factor RimM n=1 Tax=Actinobaculum sp. 313 TaxID=2495645 RepID=UPI000D528CE6|nr:hypothetical protein DDD63_07870 [Actinobaculum sp. 313]
MQLTVAVIGAAHGLKGEVRLDVRTDIPERRLAPGTMLETDPAEVGPLTVERTRQYKGATYATFVECHNRTAAEQIRGVKLTVETDEDEIEEDDAWYAHELVGLEVLDPEGYTLGEVIGLEPMPAQDLLVVREPDGLIARVPMAREIVTEVDLDDGCVVVDAPPGLFSDDELIIVGAADDDARNSHGHDRPRPRSTGRERSVETSALLGIRPEAAAISTAPIGRKARGQIRAVIVVRALIAVVRSASKPLRRRRADAFRYRLCVPRVLLRA